MSKIISKLKEFLDNLFSHTNSNLLRMNHYPPMPKRNMPKQESVPPIQDVKEIDKIKISGKSNYLEFTNLASVFCKEQKYNFVSLSLDKDPTQNDIQFTVEFWSVD